MHADGALGLYPQSTLATPPTPWRARARQSSTLFTIMAASISLQLHRVGRRNIRKFVNLAGGFVRASEAVECAESGHTLRLAF